MSLQEQIREDMVNAMKTRDTETVSLLRVVAGEFGREMKSSKQLNDVDALKVIRKLSDNAKELGNNEEVDILDKYLPEMLSDSDIKFIVVEIIKSNNYSGMKDMGNVMKKIKTLSNAALIDGSIASKIVKELLAQ